MRLARALLVLILEMLSLRVCALAGCLSLFVSLQKGFEKSLAI